MAQLCENVVVNNILISWRYKWLSLSSDERWLQLFKVAICLALLAGVIISHRLWIGERGFPQLPLFTHDLPEWMSSFIFLGFVVATLATTLTPNRIWPGVMLIFAAILVALDQLRLQPWFYLYLFMIVPLLSRTSDRIFASGYMLIITAGVYLWSGFHKLNGDFLEGFYTQLVEFFLRGRLDPRSYFGKGLGYGIGIFEMALGAGLLFRSLRKIAVVCGVLMHLIIILYLALQSGQGNMIVIPGICL